jgi:hypothetical protein
MTEWPRRALQELVRGSSHKIAREVSKTLGATTKLGLASIFLDVIIRM